MGFPYPLADASFLRVTSGAGMLAIFHDYSTRLRLHICPNWSSCGHFVMGLILYFAPVGASSRYILF